MNIQNIVALATQLETLGLSEMSSLLLKRICFKPESFTISTKLMKGNEQISFELYFEADVKVSEYILKFYDATLQKELTLPNTTINDVDIIDLDNRMKSVDWKSAFNLNMKKQWSPENKTTWEVEQSIETIITDLNQLEQSEEGKSIANSLKQKFWADIPGNDNIVNISSGKNKQDVSQRFYLFDGQPGISVDEAYRFLQNRWLEKQMQAKRKQSDDTNAEKNEQSDQASSGNGLLRKKRVGKPKGVKSKKVIQT